MPQRSFFKSRRTRRKRTSRKRTRGLTSGTSDAATRRKTRRLGFVAGSSVALSAPAPQLLAVKAKQMVRMRKVFHPAVSSSITGGCAGTDYNMASVFSTNYAGQKARGFDDWMKFYTNWKVKKAKISVTLLPRTTRSEYSGQFGLVANQVQGTLPTDLNQNLEDHRCVARIYGSLPSGEGDGGSNSSYAIPYAGRRELTLTINPEKMLDLPKDSVALDGSATTDAPAPGLPVTLWVSNSSTAMATQDFQVELDYWVELSVPKRIA